MPAADPRRRADRRARRARAAWSGQAPRQRGAGLPARGSRWVGLDHFETYVAIKAWIDNWRWAGVPFYLRTGKALPGSGRARSCDPVSPVPSILFNAQAGRARVNAGAAHPARRGPVAADRHQGAGSAGTHLAGADGLQHGEAFGDESPEAYERLLLDVMAGDATLFMRRDAVEASRAWVTASSTRKKSGARWLPEYAAGSGPVEGDRLIENDGSQVARGVIAA
ncbi:MAG: hypothetical protein U0842_12520 [Candidatus Binatia bacterium]